MNFMAGTERLDNQRWGNENARTIGIGAARTVSHLGLAKFVGWRQEYRVCANDAHFIDDDVSLRRKTASFLASMGNNTVDQSNQSLPTRVVCSRHLCEHSFHNFVPAA